MGVLLNQDLGDYVWVPFFTSRNACRLQEPCAHRARIRNLQWIVIMRIIPVSS